MKISVFGTGYVGLVTGTCFAEMGNEVLCADVDLHKIELLRQGTSPIYETDLEDLIQSNTQEGRLTFTTDLSQAVQNADILFIAVGTPSSKEGSTDLKYVLEVAHTIASEMTCHKTVVMKSTVPVGTSVKIVEAIQNQLKSRGVSHTFEVVSNPEFLREGTAVEDCLKPSRVIVGCRSEDAKKLMSRLYEPFLRNGNRLIFMDPASSELTKYAANAFLATKISFMNELSRLSEKTGADIEKIRNGIGSDPRIGYQFIYAGLGYGGSCFPKDVKSLIHTMEERSETPQILKAVESTNALQRQRFFDRISQHFHGKLAGKKFGLWGIAFKPGTDDIREAPAIDLIRYLTQAGASVIAFDPVASDAAKKLYPQTPKLTYVDTPYAALEGIDALCIATEWKQFREPNFEKMKSTMKSATIFDGRNLYNLEEMRQQGFQYFSLGRTFHGESE